MAYHEQHERKCPTCGERISATAPKCFNCGEYVDAEEEDGAEEAGRPRAVWGWVSAVVALLGVGLVVYLGCVRRANPEDEAEAEAQRQHRMIGRLAGRPELNASSPMTLAEVQPRLRAGMPLDELMRVIGEKNRGPSSSTVVGTVSLPAKGGGDGDSKPSRQGHIRPSSQ
jgi:hypothetical protein